MARLGVGLGLLVLVIAPQDAPPPMEGPVQAELSQTHYPVASVKVLGGLIINHWEEPSSGVAGATAAPPVISLSEWRSFERCFKGPGLCIGGVVREFPAVAENEWDWWVEKRLGSWCTHWDYTGDGRVDMQDLARFQQSIARGW